jgi:hypothetical protein
MLQESIRRLFVFHNAEPIEQALWQLFADLAKKDRVLRGSAGGTVDIQLNSCYVGCR